jgi:hypothetical protein
MSFTTMPRDEHRRTTILPLVHMKNDLVGSCRSTVIHKHQFFWNTDWVVASAERLSSSTAHLPLQRPQVKEDEAGDAGTAFR